MARGKGETCPTCKKQTAQNQKGCRVCSQCGTVFWDLGQVDFAPGKVGVTCHHCGKRTLHEVHQFADGTLIRRCSTCQAVLIAPPKVAD